MYGRPCWLDANSPGSVMQGVTGLRMAPTMIHAKVTIVVPGLSWSPKDSKKENVAESRLCLFKREYDELAAVVPHLPGPGAWRG